MTSRERIWHMLDMCAEYQISNWEDDSKMYTCVAIARTNHELDNGDGMKLSLMMLYSDIMRNDHCIRVTPWSDDINTIIEKGEPNGLLQRTDQR